MFASAFAVCTSTRGMDEFTHIQSRAAIQLFRMVRRVPKRYLSPREAYAREYYYYWIIICGWSVIYGRYWWGDCVNNINTQLMLLNAVNRMLHLHHGSFLRPVNSTQFDWMRRACAARCEHRVHCSATGFWMRANSVAFVAGCIAI